MSPPASAPSSSRNSRPAASTCPRASSIPTTCSTEAVMAIEPTYILYGVIFLTVILLVEGDYYFFIDSTLTKRRANRRLTMLGAGREGRAEEHTDEPQEIMRRSYAVICLKKKKQQQY